MIEREFKAFPTYYYQQEQGGMELRDYFAAKAMQGFLNAYRVGDSFIGEKFAKSAYDLADCMMKARNDRARV
jgi:hypothetical protein